MVTTPENGGRRRKRGREAARREGGMAEPNGLARSSRYSGVAGGCSVETKARDKAVVTDGIKEMEELPGTLCTSRELWLCGKGVAPWRDVARVAAKRLHASGSLARPVEKGKNKNGTRETQLGRGNFLGRGRDRRTRVEQRVPFFSSSVERIELEGTIPLTMARTRLDSRRDDDDR